MTAACSGLQQSTPKISEYQAAHDWLIGRINYERTTIPYHGRQLKLDRMRQLLTRLGDPDAGMKIIHVAGTKGKGSTAAMIACVLRAAGYRTGVYSSPHLERIEERFAVGGKPCTAEEFIDLIDRLRPIVHDMDEDTATKANGPTYFDLTTAIALQHFSDRQVDVVILEVGLGGRLDSTNVCLPAVSVITSISLDHTRQLGETLAKIAGEKAGIIKPGIPVISGVSEKEPCEVIAQIAREHGCRLAELDHAFTVGYQSSSSKHGRIDFDYSLSGEKLSIESAELALMGRHQARNAAVALATIAELRHQGWSVHEDAIRAGLKSVSVPARIELVSKKPPVILDTAHNGASAQALVETLVDYFPLSLFPFTKRQLLVSISRDKKVREIVRTLVPHFGQIVVTEYQENPRAMPVEELAEIVREEIPGSGSTVDICPQPLEAWKLVLDRSGPDDLTVITGSFFVTAELRPLVMGTKRQHKSGIAVR